MNVLSVHHHDTLRAPTAAPIEAALSRAAEALASWQDASGRMDGTTSQGTDATAQAIIALAFLGELDDADAELAARYLEAHVRADGGVPCYPMAETSSLADACLVRAALRCCGVGEREPVIRRLDGYIAAEGGPAGCDPLDQIFLVMAGELPRSVLAPSTTWHLLAPPLYSWLSRTFVVYYGAMIGILIPSIVAGLRRGDRRPDPITRRALARLVTWLAEHQNEDGNWGGGSWLTVFCLVALDLAGVEHRAPVFARGLDCMKLWRVEHELDQGRGLEFAPYRADNWNTAVTATALASVEAGEDLVGSARDWLRTQQAQAPAPEDWLNLPPDAPRVGGWAFASGNAMLSDTDTTAMVLECLAGVERGERTPADHAQLRDGLAWLRAMQNPDGGWPAFTRGQRSKGPEPLFVTMPEAPRKLRDTLAFMLEPPLEFVDCSTADVSARVLLALGAMGLDATNDPMVERAVEFLRAQRLDDTWWCRWTTGYVAASSFVLRGLAAVGCSVRSHPWIGPALDWLIACQNDDGGFGEVNASYTNRGLAGHGPSNAYLTGIALEALCVHGQADLGPAKAAARWLLDHQGADGLWVESQALQSMLPPDIFYTNYVNFQSAPIAGLRTWRNAVAR